MLYLSKGKRRIAKSTERTTMPYHYYEAEKLFRDTELALIKQRGQADDIAKALFTLQKALFEMMKGIEQDLSEIKAALK